ncbi:hypothetical protein ACTIVE_6401 [Actinomadura verrucosospora]|uniref:Uncharacterized protein n=2 Tax=Actinomadura verrucosospora TaxID=46165 RepID=A0A7D3W2J1_ACTVE|nr:hypothetical protein ACTIVE_6401 [Actinomadura verrucosospora]
MDEASGRAVTGIAVVAGVAVLLGLLACVVLVIAGIVHALIPYWPYVLAAFGVLVVLPMTVSFLLDTDRPSKRKAPSRPVTSGPSRPVTSGPSRPVASAPSSALTGEPAGPASWEGARPVVGRPSGASIDWHTATPYSCRRCGHNWTSHGHGQGSCSVEGPPYTTQTTVGWEDSIIQTESGTPCGCSRYEGVEPR